MHNCKLCGINIYKNNTEEFFCWEDDCPEITPYPDELPSDTEPLHIKKGSIIGAFSIINGACVFPGI